MTEKKEPPKKFNWLDTWDGEYQGNVFGKKVTIYGGIFTLLIVLLMVYRHVSMDVPFGGEPEQTEINTTAPLKDQTQ